MVSEADRIKAVERVGRSMESCSGNSPYTFKRKKAVWRALKRKDPDVTAKFNHELTLMSLLNGIVLDMFTAHAYLSPSGLMMKGLSEIV